MLPGNAGAQQTPAANSQPAAKAPAAKTPQTSAGASSAAPAKAPAAKAPAGSALTSQKDKASYAIGLNIGRSMHKDGVDVDPNLILRGIKDAMAGGKTLLTDDEAKTALAALQNDVRQKQQVVTQQAGAINKKEGDAFLAANKSKPGVVTLPSGLQYKILKQGSGPKPTASDAVVCNYQGTLLNGSIFDSSYARGQPATFPVSQVIRGWTEALQLMPFSFSKSPYPSS